MHFALSTPVLASTHFPRFHSLYICIYINEALSQTTPKIWFAYAFDTNIDEMLKFVENKAGVLNVCIKSLDPNCEKSCVFFSPLNLISNSNRIEISNINSSRLVSLPVLIRFTLLDYFICGI